MNNKFTPNSNWKFCLLEKFRLKNRWKFCTLENSVPLEKFRLKNRWNFCPCLNTLRISKKNYSSQTHPLKLHTSLTNHFSSHVDSSHHLHFTLWHWHWLPKGQLLYPLHSSFPRVDPLQIQGSARRLPRNRHVKTILWSQAHDRWPVRKNTHRPIPQYCIRHLSRNIRPICKSLVSHRYVKHVSHPL